MGKQESNRWYSTVWRHGTAAWTTEGGLQLCEIEGKQFLSWVFKAVQSERGNLNKILILPPNCPWIHSLLSLSWSSRIIFRHYCSTHFLFCPLLIRHTDIRKIIENIQWIILSSLLKHNQWLAITPDIRSFTISYKALHDQTPGSSCTSLHTVSAHQWFSTFTDFESAVWKWQPSRLFFLEAKSSPGTFCMSLPLPSPSLSFQCHHSGSCFLLSTCHNWSFSYLFCREVRLLSSIISIYHKCDKDKGQIILFIIYSHSLIWFLVCSKYSYLKLLFLMDVYIVELGWGGWRIRRKWIRPLFLNFLFLLPI